MNEKIAVYRWLTMVGYFGLLAELYLQLFWLNPPSSQLMVPALFLLIGPMLFPLRGLLAAKAYTHAWAAYLALYYFCVGVWYGGAAEDRVIGVIIALTSILFFTAAILFARFQGKQDQAIREAAKPDNSKDPQ